MDKNKLFDIPITINPLVPKDEIWFIDNKGNIFKIINIGNSKLCRFILWWQKLIERLGRNNGNK